MDPSPSPSDSLSPSPSPSASTSVPPATPVEFTLAPSQFDPLFTVLLLLLFLSLTSFLLSHVHLGGWSRHAK